MTLPILLAIVVSAMPPMLLAKASSIADCVTEASVLRNFG